MLKDGVITAAARGLPPPWITDIAGSEAWALLQASLRALPGLCTYKGDCLPCIQMVKAGLASATAASRVLARVYALLIPALEDTDHSRLLWMPAHKSAAHVGVAQLSDGTFLTADDVFANDAADTHAKAAVEKHRVTRADVACWKDATARANMRAMWLARATVLANNIPEYPFSDSEAARWRADEAKRNKLGHVITPKPVVVRGDKGHVPIKIPYLGGIRRGEVQRLPRRRGL